MEIAARPSALASLGALLLFGLAACAGRSADELPLAATTTSVESASIGDAVAPLSSVAPTTEPQTREPSSIIVHALGSYDRLPDPSASAGPTSRLFADDVVTTAFLGCTPGGPDCSVEGIEALIAGGVDLISVATPAADDAGAQSLDELVRALRDNGVSVVGFGQTTGEAIAPSIFNARFDGVAFHAISIAEDGSPSTRATATSAGIAGLDSVDRLLDAIADSVSANFQVVVLVSWGSPGDRAPLDSQLVFAQLLLDAGVSAIVGNGPRLQRFDLVGLTPVSYSLGIAVSSEGDPAQLDTAVARISLSDDQSSCLLPATSSPFGVVLDDQQSSPTCAP